MSTISQTSSSAANPAGTQQTAKAASASAPADNKSTEKVEDKADVSISTRAQKLAKLAEEFFPSGPRSLKISPEFIQRLQDYGLMSKAQADSLPQQLKTGSGGSNTSSELGKLTRDADALLEKLKGDDKHKTLFDVIGDVQAELKKFEQGNNIASPAETKVMIKKLSDQFETESGKSLSTENRKLIKDMAVTLNLISSFSNKSSALAGVNAYLSKS